MVSPYHYKAAFIKWWSHIHRYVLIASCGDGFSKWYKGKTFLIQSMVVPLAAWAMFFHTPRYPCVQDRPPLHHSPSILRLHPLTPRVQT